MALNLLDIVCNNPKDVIFWTGAGISWDSPSNLPSGWSLTQNIVEQFCIDGTWKTLRDYLRKADLEDANGILKEIPRLESIFGSVVSMLGYNILECLSPFDTIPNALHHFFAHHISVGGKHITLNIDLCIENAIKLFIPTTEYNIIDPEYESIDNSKEGLLLHLHGRIGNTHKELGVTIENITKGISKQITTLLLNLLLEKNTIIFFGYSGSDFFDVNPFFKKLKGMIDLSGKDIIWIDHSNDKKVLERYHDSKIKKDILDSLSLCNANVYLYQAKTIDIIKEFVTYWSFPSDTRTDASGSRKDIKISIDLEEWKKAIVTAKIFVSMGIGHEALNIRPNIADHIDSYKKYCDGKRDVDEISTENRILYIINEAMREVGLYRDANKISKKFVRQTSIDTLLYFERTASDLWLEGRLFSSLVIFKKSLKYGKDKLCKSNKFDSVYIECLRGYMQCCRDIGRLPLIGPFLMKSKIKLALDYLSATTIKTALQKSPYDLSHITRLFAWEAPELAKTINIPNYLTDKANIISVFSETDNLLGAINSKRSELINKIDSKKTVTEEEVAKLLWLSALIRNKPGIVKAYDIIQLHLFPDSFSGIQYSWTRRMEQQCKSITGFIKSALKTCCCLSTK